MTYDVFRGTLNPAQSVDLLVKGIWKSVGICQSDG